MMKPYICPECNGERCPNCKGTGVIWGRDLPYPLYPYESWVISEETKKGWRKNEG